MKRVRRIEIEVIGNAEEARQLMLDIATVSIRFNKEKVSSIVQNIRGDLTP